MAAAQQAGLRAIAITDHDTFDGYWAADEAAKRAGLELICGIEISTRHDGRPVHLLGYFLEQEPSKPFLDWLYLVQKARKERNRQMAKKLQALDIDICLEEAEALGRSVTGRLHFARVLVSKDVVSTVDQAFDQFLTEGTPGFVQMDEPALADAIRVLREAGGLPVLAHAWRLGYRNLLEEEQVLRDMRALGLLGLEVYHADHSAPVAARYLGLARKYGFCVTGGSDYHGAAKPNIRLGSGFKGNVRVPYAILKGMRSLHEYALGQVPA